MLGYYLYIATIHWVVCMILWWKQIVNYHCTKKLMIIPGTHDNSSVWPRKKKCLFISSDFAKSGWEHTPFISWFLRKKKKTHKRTRLVFILFWQSVSISRCPVRCFWRVSCSWQPSWYLKVITLIQSTKSEFS